MESGCQVWEAERVERTYLRAVLFSAALVSVIVLVAVVIWEKVLRDKWHKWRK